MQKKKWRRVSHPADGDERNNEFGRNISKIYLVELAIKRVVYGSFLLESLSAFNHCSEQIETCFCLGQAVMSSSQKEAGILLVCTPVAVSDCQ